MAFEGLTEKLSATFKKHLENLGFVAGGEVTVISSLGGNVIERNTFQHDVSIRVSVCKVCIGQSVWIRCGQLCKTDTSAATGYIVDNDGASKLFFHIRANQTTCSISSAACCPRYDHLYRFSSIEAICIRCSVTFCCFSFWSGAFCSAVFSASSAFSVSFSSVRGTE